MSANGTPLHEMTLRQLRKVASSYAISRYSRMRKEQLIAEIRKIQQSQIDTVAAPPAQATVEASKFNIRQGGLGNPAVSEVTSDSETSVLTDVDSNLRDLPDGYGESRIMLLPRDPQWAYVYWDIPNEHREELRRQGGRRLALRFYDVTDVDLSYQRPHSLQQYECDEMAREWYVPIPVSDRDYAIEIGYIANDGRWLVLARSAVVRIPPVYPSDWIDDQFIAVEWEEDLQGKTILGLSEPPQRWGTVHGNGLYDSEETSEALRVAGSLFGSAHQAPPPAPSSHVFAPALVSSTATDLDQPEAIQTVGETMKSLPRNEETPPFWLAAGAELVVYGATEPSAKVTIAGRPVKLNADGTFRVKVPFQDGLLDYPISAVSAGGQDIRAIHITFTRETTEVEGTENMNQTDEVDVRRKVAQEQVA
ncbi:MAG: DUF4912 domain-containing protein [Leptolyngbyaceae bacterium]|nr:DUF4912 domain-containing protein [Leptolyngbyaceae bacterium]